MNKRNDDETEFEESSWSNGEYLMVETLIARARLGEPFWTFMKRQRKIAARLEERGVVSYKPGVAPDTILVSLTDLAREVYLGTEFAFSEIVSVDRGELASLREQSELYRCAVSQEIEVSELAASFNARGAEVKFVSGQPGISHPGIRVLAAAAMSMLSIDPVSPPNYQSAGFSGTLASGESYIVEVASCKSEAQTPHALRMKAETEAGELREKLARCERELAEALATK